MFELLSFLRNILPFRFKMLMVVTRLTFSRCTRQDIDFKMHFETGLAWTCGLWLMYISPVLHCISEHKDLLRYPCIWRQKL